MRVLVVLALSSGAVLAMCLSCPAATPGMAQEAQPAGINTPSDFLTDLLWPFALMVGYISIDLKRQLQRRGSPSSKRHEAFSDLISLGHAPPAGNAPTRRDGRSEQPQS